MARLVAIIDIYREALEKARHGLIVCNNCTATDRPDLVTIPGDLCWVIDNSIEIAAIDKTLNVVPEVMEG